VSVHGTYIALEPSLDGKEPTAFKAVVLSLITMINNAGIGVKMKKAAMSSIPIAAIC
jgi:hypothetical protein